MAHWDSQGVVSAADRGLIHAVSSCGFDVIVVTTADCRPGELSGLLGEGVIAAGSRDNIGFDFLSWSRGLDAWADLPRLRRLLLLNTSVYGPVRPFGRFLDRVFDGTTDVVGFTGSRELLPHAQSYALAFGPAAIGSSQFGDYWARVRPSRAKWGTILGHELRWQRDLTGPGLRAGVVVPAPPRPVNPLTLHWRDLVEHGFPFLKKSLFTVNYDDVDMTGWRDQVGIGHPVVEMIEHDLHRLGHPVP
ncbi:MAG: rhamnan synthesis F family protein [Candidatus Nanopelagicales bacterium]